MAPDRVASCEEVVELEPRETEPKKKLEQRETEPEKKNRAAGNGTLENKDLIADTTFVVFDNHELGRVMWKISIDSGSK